MSPSLKGTHFGDCQTHVSAYFHVVFSTKNRVHLVTPEIEAEIFAYLGCIARAFGAVPTATGGTANHIHLLRSVSKNHLPPDLIGAIKRDSSKWINTRELLKFAWQDGCWVSSSNVLESRIMSEPMKWWVDFAAILTFIITAIGAVVGVYGYVHYRCEFHRKSKSLEKYLQDKKAGDKPLDKLGQRSVLQIVRDVGLTEDEIIRISFHNRHVARRVKTDEKSNLATDLLFEYEEH